MSHHDLTRAEFESQVIHAMNTLDMARPQAFEVVRDNLAYLNRVNRPGGPLGVSVEGVPVERVEFWP